MNLFDNLISRLSLRRHSGSAALAAVALLLASSAGQAKLNVVATTPDLAAIAQAIGGAEVTITTLAKPTEDPHFVDAKPSFIAKLNHADALIEGGAELESGWLGPLLENARNPRLAPGAPGRIQCAQGIQMLEVPTTLDRSRGDEHAAGNPHFLGDPANAQIVAKHLADAFCQIDAKKCETYRANAANFSAMLTVKLEEWKKSLAPYANQRIAAYHNLWPYFAKRFDLKIDLFLEPKPGLPPTPAHLREVIARMKTEHVKVIILEPHQNRRTAESVAEATGAQVLGLTQYPGGVKGADGSYVDMMNFIVQSLARALGAK